MIKRENIKDKLVYVAIGAVATAIGLGIVFVADSNKSSDIKEVSSNTEEIVAADSETKIKETVQETTEQTGKETTEQTTEEKAQTEAVIENQTTEAVIKEENEQSINTNKGSGVKENAKETYSADLSAFINENGTTVKTRFKVPDGFVRMRYEEDSYSDRVQNLSLKSYGTVCYEYDGGVAEHPEWYASVIVTQFHKKGWLQCADCVMKLVADYLYSVGKYGDITFEYANSSRVNFLSWSGGNYDHATYNNFMSEVYYSANTYSLKNQKESVRLSLDNIYPGAYFIMEKDSSHEYGHAVFVADVAKNPNTGEIAFLLAQGSTPSQDMGVIKNPLHPNDPWYYTSEIGSTFKIPGWTFKTSNLFYYDAIGILKGDISEKQTEIQEVTKQEQTTDSQNETTTKIEETTKTEETTTTEETTVRETAGESEMQETTTDIKESETTSTDSEELTTDEKETESEKSETEENQGEQINTESTEG